PPRAGGGATGPPSAGLRAARDGRAQLTCTGVPAAHAVGWALMPVRLLCLSPRPVGLVYPRRATIRQRDVAPLALTVAARRPGSDWDGEARSPLRPAPQRRPGIPSGDRGAPAGHPRANSDPVAVRLPLIR